jgi:hypothetical protein
MWQRELLNILKKKDVADGIIEYSEKGRINIKTNKCHVSSNTAISTCVCVFHIVGIMYQIQGILLFTSSTRTRELFSLHSDNH